MPISVEASGAGPILADRTMSVDQVPNQNELRGSSIALKPSVLDRNPIPTLAGVASLATIATLAFSGAVNAQEETNPNTAALLPADCIVELDTSTNPDAVPGVVDLTTGEQVVFPDASPLSSPLPEITVEASSEGDSVPLATDTSEGVIAENESEFSHEFGFDTLKDLINRTNRPDCDFDTISPQILAYLDLDLNSEIREKIVESFGDPEAIFKAGQTELDKMKKKHRNLFVLSEGLGVVISIYIESDGDEAVYSLMDGYLGATEDKLAKDYKATNLLILESYEGAFSEPDTDLDPIPNTSVEDDSKAIPPDTSETDPELSAAEEIEIIISKKNHKKVKIFDDLAEDVLSYFRENDEALDDMDWMRPKIENIINGCKNTLKNFKGTDSCMSGFSRITHAFAITGDKVALNLADKWIGTTKKSIPNKYVDRYINKDLRDTLESNIEDFPDLFN